MNEIINSALSGLSTAKAGVQKSADNIAKSISVVEKIQSTDVVPEVAGELDKFNDIDLATEVVSMIVSARSYEFNLKSVEAWSEMTKSAIDMVDDK